MQCGILLPASRGHRAADYCGRACRQRAYRRRQVGRRTVHAPAPAPADELAITQEIAQDLAELLDDLRRELADAPGADGRALSTAAQMQDHLETLTAGLVGLERSHRTTWRRIGELLGTSEEAVRRRFHPDRVERRLHPYTRVRTSAAALPAPSGVLSSPRQPGAVPSPQPAVPELAAGPPPLASSRPAGNRLSGMLSVLVRATGRPQYEIARAAGCSPSHLSKILSGTKVPTWRLTEALARACGGDPAPLYTPWSRERLREFRGQGPALSVPVGLTAKEAHNVLTAAVATLHVRAGSPNAYELAVASKWKLSIERILRILKEHDYGDWAKFSQVVYLLGSEGDYIRQLWRVAYPAAPLQPPTPPEPAAPLPAAPQPASGPMHQAGQASPPLVGALRDGVAARIRRAQKPPTDPEPEPAPEQPLPPPAPTRIPAFVTSAAPQQLVS
ncbi:helix-turn-helix domain-containing protein [Kitasatospora sp. NPDC006697]|uniref:helix-turn-helix domain-containing protein n=1 Tax=Kitasatospora sp. NPDC006697 TaxID=3364020 RepID=UPI0036BF9366